MQNFAEIFTLLESSSGAFTVLICKYNHCLRALRIFANKTLHQLLDLDSQFQMDSQCLDVY